MSGISQNIAYKIAAIIIIWIMITKINFLAKLSENSLRFVQIK